MNREACCRPSPEGQSGLLWIPVLLSVLVLASWTLAYHLTLAAGLPARSIYLPFTLLLAGLLLLARGDLARSMRASAPPTRSDAGALLLLLVSAFGSLFVANPNPDDLNFFHRALAQLPHLDQPFFRSDTLHELPDLPALSAAHLMTSHEHFVAMLAQLLGVDPLFAYQKLAGAAGQGLFVCTYLLLYRELGLTPARSLLATLLAALFFFTDLRLPGRSFGNIILSLYNGKVLLWGVWIPLTLLLAVRFLRAPGGRELAYVALAGVGAVGLSGSGIFMVPVLLAGLSVQDALRHRRLTRAALLGLASVYGVSIALASIVGWIPRPSNVSVWMRSFPSGWWENLALVLDRPAVLVRDIALLALAPLAALGPASRWLLPALAASLCVLFANPLAAAFWLETVTPGAYWRLLFLFPVPLCAGLIGECAIRAWRGRGTDWSRTAVAIGLVLAVALAHVDARSRPADIARSLRLDSPGAYRLHPEEIAFAEAALPHLEGRVVLAPQASAVTLGLLEPRLRFVASRGTRHVFANAGREAEGARRVEAQRFAATCGRTGSPAFFDVLEGDFGAVVLAKCPAQPPAWMAQLDDWVEAARHGDHRLLLRVQPGAASEAADAAGAERDL